MTTQRLPRRTFYTQAPAGTYTTTRTPVCARSRRSLVRSRSLARSLARPPACLAASALCLPSTSSSCHNLCPSARRPARPHAQSRDLTCATPPSYRRAFLRMNVIVADHRLFAYSRCPRLEISHVYLLLLAYLLTVERLSGVMTYEHCSIAQVNLRLWVCFLFFIWLH